MRVLREHYVRGLVQVLGGTNLKTFRIQVQIRTTNREATAPRTLPSTLYLVWTMYVYDGTYVFTTIEHFVVHTVILLPGLL